MRITTNRHELLLFDFEFRQLLCLVYPMGGNVEIVESSGPSHRVYRVGTIPKSHNQIHNLHKQERSLAQSNSYGSV